MSDINLIQLQDENFGELSVKDYKLMFSFGVFNDRLMNTAVGKFKCYEDVILEYAGIFIHIYTKAKKWAFMTRYSAGKV